MTLKIGLINVHNFIWLHNLNYIGGVVMYWFMILAGAGFVSINNSNCTFNRGV